MEYWFTVRNVIDWASSNNSWKEEYVRKYGPIRFEEIVSLDKKICPHLFDSYDDYKEGECVYDDYNEQAYSSREGEYLFGFFKSEKFILEKIKDKNSFNLLLVIREPRASIEQIEIENYEFVGYDLIDKAYCDSGLLNLSLKETFNTKSYRNKYGLMNSYQKVFEFRKQLIIDNPDEWNASCFVFGVFRHKTLGRML